MATLTSWRSGSLLCGAEWGRMQRKHKLVSSDFSQPRQPPSASCRDGPAQLHSLQLEMEGSRWPCLAQIPARLPGRCGQSDGLAPGAGIHRRRAGATSLPLLWGLASMGCGGSRDIDCGFTVVLESAAAQSPLERDGLCLFQPH